MKMRVLFVAVLCMFSLPTHIELSVAENIFSDAEIKLTDEMLLQFLKDNNAWFPELLVRQAKLESGNYKKDIFIQQNNLFGMRRCKVRQNLQIGHRNGHGVYNSWMESALDRIMWDTCWYHNVKPDSGTYVSVLKHYAKDSNYIDKLMKIKIRKQNDVH